MEVNVGVASGQCYSSAGLCTTSSTVRLSWCVSGAMMLLPSGTQSTWVLAGVCMVSQSASTWRLTTASRDWRTAS